ncbi:MAG: hypothetical protein A3B68_08360 [Candidatus Melainabacteria bacterium RIFCSPHIGHO2_02_FULL_34_12]|nr:MAG: hypothetical protein A3B68_08360 [Candidatus Melainabacteria bacterium RIFCSPHIGHO2_02_FULL_34_12]
MGLGLIGGSLALSLKSAEYKVIGITRNKETIDSALKTNAIDKGFTELSSEALLDVDVLFIATPLSQIISDIKKIGSFVNKEIIVSDVGSTKSDICIFAKKNLPQNVIFIGGHPMAGTEKSGFTFSTQNLFKDHAWVLTPLDESTKNRNAVALLKKIIISAGAIPVISSYERHDQAVALISHLPLLVSLGLCQMARKRDQNEIANLTAILASSGFRDMTRIGGGNPQLNFDLISSNISQLSLILPKFCNEVENILKLVKENPETLKKAFNEISKWQNDLYDKNGKNTLLNI